MQLIGEHPNFLRIYEIFEGESTYYVIMDYMKGKTLQEDQELFSKEKDVVLKEKLIKDTLK